jgi:hypothetical protein
MTTPTPTTEEVVNPDFIDGQPDISKVFERHEESQYAFDHEDKKTRLIRELGYGKEFDE